MVCKEEEPVGKPWWGEVNDWRKKSGLTCSFVVFAALNIAMMVIGIQSINKCPMEPMIPNYLIVAGSTSLSLLLVRLVVSHILVPSLEQSGSILSAEGGEEDPKANKSMILRTLNVFDTLASVFSTCWLIAGSVYVYGSNPQHKNVNESDYCDYTAYMFAFVVITIGYVSLFLSILAAVLHCCFRSK